MADGWNLDLATTYGKDDVLDLREGHRSTGRSTSTPRRPRRPVPRPPTSTRAPSSSPSGPARPTSPSEFDVGMAAPLNVALGGRVPARDLRDQTGRRGLALQGRLAVLPRLPVHRRRQAPARATRSTPTWRCSPTEPLKLDLAARYEHFSDFGDTFVVKGTGRYDFNDDVRHPRHGQHRLPRPDPGGVLLFGHQRLADVGLRAAAAELRPRPRWWASNGLDPEKSTQLQRRLRHPPGLRRHRHPRRLSDQHQATGSWARARCSARAATLNLAGGAGRHHGQRQRAGPHASPRPASPSSPTA